MQIPINFFQLVMPEINLPAGIDCYEVKISDSFGDGMSITSGGPDAGWELFDSNQNLID